MNKIILCEGMTDAILLSYYLDKVAGWKYCRKPPKDIAIKEDHSRGESLNWYEKDSDRLLICGVGGKDNMGSFFNNKILRTIVDAGAFSRGCSLERTAGWSVILSFGFPLRFG